MFASFSVRIHVRVVLRVVANTTGTTHNYKRGKGALALLFYRGSFPVQYKKPSWRLKETAQATLARDMGESSGHLASHLASHLFSQSLTFCRSRSSSVAHRSFTASLNISAPTAKIPPRATSSAAARPTAAIFRNRTSCLFIDLRRLAVALAAWSTLGGGSTPSNASSSSFTLASSSDPKRYLERRHGGNRGRRIDDVLEMNKRQQQNVSGSLVFRHLSLVLSPPLTTYRNRLRDCKVITGTW